MDQEAWNQIYADLENDLAAIKRRGEAIADLDVILGIDKVRFAMKRGDTDEAIFGIQNVKRLLRGGDVPVTRGGPPPATSPALDRLDALEDSLHAMTRLGSARLEIVGEDEEEPTRAASQNTKVNKSIKYDDIKDELSKLWNACQIRPDKKDAVRREADRVVANRKTYAQIEAETKVPWWFIGLIHGMECSFSLQQHLHNGDSLKARTWQVPAGRPKEGSAPFTFVESAIDALQYDGFAGMTDWPLPMVLFRLERYNGFGYRKKFGFASPYLWSYTNHFSSGKYVKDGVFDPNAISKQCGAAAMLRDLMDRGVVVFEDKKPTVVAVPKPEEAPAPSPAPAPVPEPAPVPAVPAPSSALPTVVPIPVAPDPAPVTVPANAAQTVPAAGTPAQPTPLAPAAASPSEPAPKPEPVAAPAAVAGPATAPAAPSHSPSPPTTDAVPPAPATSAAPSAGPGTAAVSARPDENAEAPPTPPGMSPAVAAALAELAKRSK